MFWPIFVFLVYWVILFVVCFIVSEYSQKFLYDEATPMLGWKVAGGTFLMALLLARFRTSYDTMFTSEIHWTLLQAIIWVVLFAFLFRFHFLHAAAIGLGTFVVVSGLASIGVDSLMGNTPEAARVQIARPAKPLRKPAYVGPAPATTPQQNPENPDASSAGKEP
jgi:hypothetical protein